MVIKISPIQHLLDDPFITEVMVNCYDRIFVERDGIVSATSTRFANRQELTHYIESILSYDGHDTSNGRLFFDGMLPIGYRYNIVLAPMNPQGPSLTIRKFSDKKFKLETLVQKQSLTEKSAYFLSLLVRAKSNIIVSGGTGSGKTTFLQALTSEISDEERIVTIEDVPELRLHQQNWVQLLSIRDPKNPVTVRDCLINSLRMRPDRIIVGECRKDEAFDMLQAMNTGHEGSMTSIHANSPLDCLTRMENLLHMVGFDVPLKTIRRQIADTIQYIVQLKRTSGGQRIVSEILEITGMEHDTITRASVFELNKQGYLESTGYVPKQTHALQERGFIFPRDFFSPQFKKIS